MHVWNVLHAVRWKHRAQKSRQKSPSVHHRTNLSGYIFATKARIDNRKKRLSSNTSSRCPHNIVNFGHERLKSVYQFGARQLIPTSFATWQRYCTASSSGRQPNFAVLNRRRHLYSAGWPSRWALAHILVYNCILLVIKSRMHYMQ